MTDPTPEGFADTPGPDATPEQDADVRALLAFLRDEPMEMPPDVAARLDAVIAEERRTAALAAGTASALVDPADTSPSPHASVTVLPTPEERRGPSMRAFKVVGGLAAAALVVVGGVTLVNSLGSSSSSLATAGASAASVGEGAKDASGTTVTASGQDYSGTRLASAAAALVAGRSASQPLGSTPVPSLPEPAATTDTTSGGVEATASTPASGSPGLGYVATPFALDKAAACVAALTDSDGSTGVAIDSGTFDGKAALVVVVTDPADPASLRVFVTAPDCSPNFRQVQRIARP